MDDAEVLAAAKDLWQLHLADRPRLDRIHGFVTERYGKPKVPDDASPEVHSIAGMSYKNVLTLVRDSFAQNLSVVGYRSSSSGSDLPAWQMWRRNRMNARQAEIYRPALTYGASYVAVIPGEDGLAMFRPRSPRNMLAAYTDPQSDAWPEMALEMWVETKGKDKVRKGLLYTDELVYPLILGTVVVEGDAANFINPQLDPDFPPFPHGASHCPVVRYVNRRDAEEIIVGEIEPLLTLQQAINNVNFDRLIVSRFGAFPQKVISGWTPSSKEEALATSARRVWAFEDFNVNAQTFAAAAIGPYNELLNEMFEHVAMVAQISPAQVTGQIVNVSAEALAASEANEQRKLVAMRESYGEGHEQLLSVGAEIEGDTSTAEDIEAEVVWRDTEARSFGAVVDGVTKLSAQGVPITELLHLVPGVTQRQIQEIRRSQGVQSMFKDIRAAADAAKQDPVVAGLSERRSAVLVDGS